MKSTSLLLVALVAIALAGTSIVGLANPMTPLPGYDDVPYFSDATGVPNTFFAIGDNVYISYFDTTFPGVYNDHVNSPDTMYVSVNSQSTEGAATAVDSGCMDDTDGNSVPGDDPAEAPQNGSGSEARLSLIETGNNTAFFIGDLATTPVTVLAGDKVVVGLVCIGGIDSADTAWIEATHTGTAPHIWYDMAADPGTRGWGPGGTIPAAPGPGDGAYGRTDQMVWEMTIHGYIGPGAPTGFYYRRNSGLWQAIAPAVVGGAYPTWRLGYTPPAPPTGHGDLIEFLYDPTATPLVGATPVFGDTIIDQPVDVANATYGLPTPPGPAPDDGCTGFLNEYMTLGAAIAGSVVNGWIGVHDTPVAYDARFEPAWPIVINLAGLTVMSASPATIDGSGGIGIDVQNMITITGNGVTFGTPGHGFNIIAPVGQGTAANNVKALSLQGTPVTIEANNISGFPYCAIEVFRGAPNPKQITIKDNTLTTSLTSGGNEDGVGLYSDGGFAYQSLVSGNTIHNFLVGINVQNLYDPGASWTAPSATFIDNTIYDTYANGLSVSSADGDPVYPTPWDKTQYVVIRENTIYDVGGNAVSIHEDATGDTSDFRVWFNDIYDSGHTNVAIPFGGVHVRANVDATTVSVEYNSFVNNTYAPPGSLGVLNDGTGLLTCELNWWGSTTGPAHNLNANGVGDGAGPAGAVFVDYRPWLNGKPVCGALSDGTLNTNTAFQGNKTVQGSSWHWTINQALKDVNDLGCTGAPPCRVAVIDVGPGTYAEEIVFGYGNIGSTTIRSTGGKAVTNIEGAAGAASSIIVVNNGYQHLKIGDGGAVGLGFNIYFDAAAVPVPAAHKIEFLGTDLQIYDCTIDGTTQSGIHVNSASAGGTIARNLITGCQVSGIWLELVGGAGMTLDGNTVENCGDGVTIDSGMNTLINNIIRFNTNHGIDLNSNGNQVGGSGNNIHNNTENGIRVNSQGNTFEGNEIHANGMYGVLLTGAATGNAFDTNKIYSNANPGVQLNAAAGNVFNTDNSSANTNCIWDNDFNGNYGALPYGQMENTTLVNVDATNNYWGSMNGPFNAMRNPSGDPNNRVSDFILIDPWARACGGGTVYATNSMNCGAGWWLTSVPLVPGDPIAQNVYGAFPVFAAYKWNPGTAQYDDLTGVAINWDDGFWLWLMGNETVTVYGTSVETVTETFAFGAAGWQQFSVPSIDIPVTGPDEGGRADPDIRFRDPNAGGPGVPGPWYTYNDSILNGLILDGIFRYNTCNGVYDPAMGSNAVLDPWVGYWIETLIAGVEIEIPVKYWIDNPWVAPTGFSPMSVDTKGRIPPAPPVLPQSLIAALDEATGLLVYNEPNPIRDVNTTTFRVKAAEPIDAIRVEIYDQAGTLVFGEEQPGEELVWHTQSDGGEYLANGVYLYRVLAKINGRWVVAEVRKLAIFR